MVKSELINAITDRLINKPENHLGIKDIELSVNQVLEYLSEALGSGQRIEIRGFGSFCLHYRPPRNAHNPKTGEKVFTEAKNTPHFKPGKEMRDRVNASYGQPLTGLDDLDSD
jgi:integration host factor subunit beta